MLLNTIDLLVEIQILNRKCFYRYKAIQYSYDLDCGLQQLCTKTKNTKNKFCEIGIIKQNNTILKDCCIDRR